MFSPDPRIGRCVGRDERGRHRVRRRGARFGPGRPARPRPGARRGTRRDARILTRRGGALAAGLGACVAAWLGGFGWFALDADRASHWPARADGIVVLTGGALRVETALALLQAGVADRLLISGVPRGITLPSLLDAAWQRPAPGAVIPAAREAAFWRGPTNGIAVGHGAQTTRGNASETAAWAEAGSLHDLVVVTAGYHMRRALAELAMALPAARFHAYAVHPPGAGWRVLFTEYNKLLLVEAGVVPPPAAGDTI